jgi:hypothetical protein
MKALALVLLGIMLLGCTPAGGTAGPSTIGSPAGSPPSVTGVVTAGPVCPVERNPPDPSCAPRAVVGAVIEAVDAGGHVVARATTAADGSYVLTVGETGTLTITAQPVAGFMRPPAPKTVTLAVPGATERVDLEYDTGIR